MYNRTFDKPSLSPPAVCGRVPGEGGHTDPQCPGGWGRGPGWGPGEGGQGVGLTGVTGVKASDRQVALVSDVARVLPPLLVVRVTVTQLRGVVTRATLVAALARHRLHLERRRGREGREGRRGGKERGGIYCIYSVI